jgi:hypothetical protein
MTTRAYSSRRLSGSQSAHRLVDFALEHSATRPGGSPPTSPSCRRCCRSGFEPIFVLSRNWSPGGNFSPVAGWQVARVGRWSPRSGLRAGRVRHLFKRNSKNPPKIRHFFHLEQSKNSNKLGKSGLSRTVESEKSPFHQYFFSNAKFRVRRALV